MAKIGQTACGDLTGDFIAKTNEAMQTVEVESSISGTGEAGSPLTVSPMLSNTGRNILFDYARGRIYNEAAPLTGGVITLDSTNAIIGAKALVYVDGSNPAPTVGGSIVILAGTYLVGSINVFEYVWNGSAFQQNIISNLDNKANKIGGPTPDAIVTQFASGDIKNSGVLITDVVLKATNQIDMVSGIIEAPTDKKYKIVIRTAYAGKITLTTTSCTSGTCTATFEINNTPLGGTANSVSSVTNSQTHASANTFSESGVIAFVISANAATVDMSFTVKIEHALA